MTDKIDEDYLRFNCFSEARKLNPHKKVEDLVKDAQCIERYVRNIDPCRIVYLVERDIKR